MKTISNTTMSKVLTITRDDHDGGAGIFEYCQSSGEDHCEHGCGNFHLIFFRQSVSGHHRLFIAMGTYMKLEIIRLKLRQFWDENSPVF